jgi:biopolymer transport protein ExbD
MRGHKAQPGGVNLGLIITPMLDMSFQILAFFIMTYHPSALEGHLSGSLVGRESGQAGPDPIGDVLEDRVIADLADAVTVIVKTGGAMPGKPDKLLIKRAVDGAPRQIADGNNSWEHAKRELDREMRRTRKEADAEKASVRIEADTKLRQEYVIEVYDVCKNAGFSKIHFVPPPR